MFFEATLGVKSMGLPIAISLVFYLFMY